MSKWDADMDGALCLYSVFTLYVRTISENRYLTVLYVSNGLTDR